MKHPRVLIGSPTSERHEYVIRNYLDNISNFSYPNGRFDLMLVDTTNDNGEYFRKLKEMSKKYKFKIILRRHIWNPKDRHPLQMLADARETIRKFMLKNDYRYLFNLDTDVLPPADSMERLIRHDKDQVGFLIHVYHKPFPQQPATFKSGSLILGKGLDYYTWDEIKKLKKLSKVYATSFGCLMIKRKVIEKVPFRTHPTFIFGEDLWFYNEANDKGFESWLDRSIRVIHKNTSWSSVMADVKSKQQVWLAQGNDNGTVPEVEVIQRANK